MSSATCDVHSDFAIRIEVGLEHGGAAFKNSLQPGSNHRTFDLCRGLNTGVPRDIIEPWLRTNRRYLGCIKERRIRIVEQVEPAPPAV
jgi:hypothetical protein